MSVDDQGFYTVTVTEARTLPEREFRDLFVQCVGELRGELAEVFTERVDFLDDEGRLREGLTTGEMREAVLRYQDFFNPKPKILA